MFDGHLLSLNLIDTSKYNYPQHVGYVFSFICEYS